MYELLAQETAPASGATPPAPWWSSPFIMFGGIALIWWFLVLGPQRKQDKARKSKIAALKKGDKVLTRAGIIGVVSRIKDDVVVVRIDTKGETAVPFQKGAIEDVLTGGAGTEG